MQPVVSISIIVAILAIGGYITLIFMTLEVIPFSVLVLVAILLPLLVFLVLFIRAARRHDKHMIKVAAILWV